MPRAILDVGALWIVLVAVMWAGAASAAVPTRWTEAKAETQIERGTSHVVNTPTGPRVERVAYHVVNRGEVVNANNDVLRFKGLLACRSSCPPQSVIDDLTARLAAAEAKLATALSGRPLTLASCHGYYGRRLGPATGFGSYRIPTYTRFRCEATLVGQTWKTGAAMVYSLYLRPGGWNGGPTKHGFRVLGLRLMPAA